MVLQSNGYGVTEWRTLWTGQKPEASLVLDSGQWATLMPGCYMNVIWVSRTCYSVRVTVLQSDSYGVTEASLVLDAGQWATLMPECYRGGTGCNRRCYKSVTEWQLWCYTGKLGVGECYRGATLIPGCYRGVTRYSNCLQSSDYGVKE
jgi:hypothetical protein